jgi:pseudomonalisin
MDVRHRVVATAVVATFSFAVVPVASFASFASIGTTGATAGTATRFIARPVARRDLIDLGRAPAATPVRLALMLRYRNQTELDGLVRLQATPGSPLYHHFLTRAQFAAAFAPSPADVARVAASLAAAGFRVAPVLPNRTIVDATGSAAAAERYFGTQLHRVAQAGYGIRYANATPATVPAAIGDVVRSVAGIDNLVKMRSQRRRAVTGDFAPYEPDAVSPDLTGPVERIVGGKFAGIYPTGIAKAYHFPSQNKVEGGGHAIAIVIDSDISTGNLATFWQAAKVTRTGKFYRVLVEGSNPGVTGDVGETAIDAEMASSLAPGADVYLYLIPYLEDQPIEDAYNLAVNDAVVDVTSSSFGGCELDDVPFADATNAIAEQAGSEGMTFTASSGDAGGYCEDATPQNGTFYEADVVNSPASGTYFLAIGGTKLTINKTTGAWVSESAWSPGGTNGGGGGGVSSHFPVSPDYQTGLAGVAVVPTIVATPPASQPSGGFAGRNLPDISLDASNGNDSYVAIYDTPDGGWTGYGGTSVSNPMFAALLAEVNQEQGSYSGYFNPALYWYLGHYGYGTAFRDITNGSTGAGWMAAAGYDQSTGIGSIKNGYTLGSF